MLQTAIETEVDDFVAHHVDCVCLALSGCVSLFTNGVLMERMDPPRFYEGVRSSAEFIANRDPEVASPAAAAGRLLMILDLPLEAAMDTLLLPWVIAGTIEHNRIVEASPAASEQQDPTAHSESPILTSDRLIGMKSTPRTVDH